MVKAGMVAGAVVIMIVGTVIVAQIGSISSDSDGSGGTTIIPVIGIGLLIVGFVLFIAGLAASNENPYLMMMRQSQGQEPSGYHCMKCGATLILGYNKCPSCNKKVKWGKVLKLQHPVNAPNQSSPAAPTTQMPISGQKFCPECGAKNSGKKFCPDCGFRLQ